MKSKLNDTYLPEIINDTKNNPVKKIKQQQDSFETKCVVGYF